MPCRALLLGLDDGEVDQRGRLAEQVAGLTGQHRRALQQGDGLGGPPLLGQHPAQQVEHPGLGVRVVVGAGGVQSQFQQRGPAVPHPPHHLGPLEQDDPPRPVVEPGGPGRDGGQGQIVALGRQPAHRRRPVHEVPYGRGAVVVLRQDEQGSPPGSAVSAAASAVAM